MFYIEFIKNNKHGSFLSLLIMLNIIIMTLATPVKAEKIAEQKRNNDYGLPTHRRDGGSRGTDKTCIADNNSSLIALIPEEKVGINASASPQLFFYVPKVNQQKTLEFILRNEQDQLIYEAFLTTEGDGIISVDIPAEVRANLDKKEQNYHWYLSMICNSKQRSRDIVVEGWMRQSEVDDAIEAQLENADSIVQAELYQEQGFWYDALAILASDRAYAPEKPVVQAKWKQLLDSVGLEELATVPFVESEVIESSY